MNFKKVSTKVLSVLMAAMMLFGVAAPVISAASWTTEDGHVHTSKKEDVINLVSYGDSMTNGFGLYGYDSPADGQNGYLDYGVDSYANQFAAWLAGYNGVIEDNQTVFEGSNGKVNHTQLATSAMRVEDLLFALLLQRGFREGHKHRHRNTRGRNLYRMLLR